MKPSYTVIPTLHENRIEAGEPLHIDIYISGYGHLERNKLYIQQPNLLDDTAPGTMTVAVRDGRIEGSVEDFRETVEGLDFVREYMDHQEVDGVIPLTGEDSVVTRPLDQPANRTNLVHSFFLDDPDSIRAFQSMDDRRAAHSYPGIVAEGYHDGHPPIQLRLHTREDARSGDYSLKVVFTYGTDTDIYQDVQSVDVHVKTPRERLEPIPTLARLAAVAIAVTGLGWTISPLIGTAVFILIIGGGVIFHEELLDLFEKPPDDAESTSSSG